MTATAEIRDIDVMKTWCLESTMNFTRFFFKERFGKKYQIAQHHKQICEALDKVIRGEITRLIINIGPRFGKTEIAVKSFMAYGLALNPASKFIHLSYSDDLARDNSREVQNIVKSESFQALFDAELESESTKKWFTTSGGGVYAVSSGGQVTGFGAGAVDYEEDEETEKDLQDFTPYYDSEFAGAIIIDDPIKPDDALSDNKRDAVNNKFETTIRNRTNSRKTPIIIIMQRLHTNDLCGYLEQLEPDEWTVLEFPSLYTDENGEEQALWPQKLNVEELNDMRLKNPFVFETQYQQNPKPKEGLMYERGFRTYDKVPYSLQMVRKNYTDTADTGSDYLCSIDYVETDTGNYILDVLYTQKPMEFTEPAQAEMMTKNQIEKAVIESNNGGRTYGRNVEAQCRLIKNNFTTFESFFQSDNKAVRIFTKSNEAQNLCFFPTGWENMWPDFYNHLTGYMKTGNNKHDDACFVAGTMIATLYGNKPIEEIKIGDKIITPFGVRKVLDCGITGLNKKVISRFGVTATPNHKVFTKDKFTSLEFAQDVEIQYLTLKNLLIWRYRKMLLSTELNTDLWGRENIIFLNQTPMRDEKAQRDFMLRFGSFITEKKFRKAFVFTIKTIILLITVLKIWSVYQLGNIYHSMREKISKTKNIKKIIRKYFAKLERKPLNGTGAKKAGNGILNIHEIKKEFQKNFNVIIAKMNLRVFIPTHNFAVINAGSNTEENSKEFHIKQNALCVTQNLKAPKLNHASPKEKHVLKNASQNLHIATVYNLTVEKDHVYYANGLLVSNCDALTGTIEQRENNGGAPLDGLFF